MTLYIYFVSYNLTNGSDTGVGSIEMTMFSPITTIQHVRDIEVYVNRINDSMGTGMKCHVINYILLRIEEKQ